MIEKIGWKTSALASMLCAVLFFLWDNEVQVSLQRAEYGASGAFAVITTVFLVMTVVCAVIALHKLWTEPEKA